MCNGVLLCTDQNLGIMPIAPPSGPFSVLFDAAFGGQISLCFWQRLKVAPYYFAQCFFVQWSRSVLTWNGLKTVLLCSTSYFILHLIEKVEPRSAYGSRSKVCSIAESGLHAVIYAVLHPAVKSCSALARVSKWSFSHVHERLISIGRGAKKINSRLHQRPTPDGARIKEKQTPVSVEELLHIRQKAKGKEIQFPLPQKTYGTEIQKFPAVDLVLPRIVSI